MTDRNIYRSSDVLAQKKYTPNEPNLWNEGTVHMKFRESSPVHKYKECLTRSAVPTPEPAGGIDRFLEGAFVGKLYISWKSH